MDIVLVNPFPDYARGINETTFVPPLGPAYIASYLREHGFSCAIVDAHVLQMSESDILVEIQRLDPGVVGISVNVISYQAAVRLSKLLKQETATRTVIMGGPQVSALVGESLRNSAADAAIFGEGEETVLEIMERRRSQKPLFDDVRGVAFWRGEEVVINPPRERIRNLDQLPFPAFDLLPNLTRYSHRVRRTPAMPIMTSRGCPYGCTFCSKSTFGRRVTFRSTQNVIQEIDYAVEKYHIKQLDVLDDAFATKRQRALEILTLLSQRSYPLAINFQNGIRADSIDDELIDLMKKASVFRIAFGIESGDEAILRGIKKGTDVATIRRACTLAQKAGFIVDGFFMLGLPGDTEQTMQATIRLAKELPLNNAEFFITLPLPATELYDFVKGNGRLLVDARYGLSTGFNVPVPAYEMDGLKKEEVIFYYKKAYREFYFRPKKIMQFVLSIKSLEELRWVVKTSIAVLKGLFVSRGN
ncbi:MAG: radical SAM protein [Chloroflexi bacterium]|nr:radical SAM protein [Chloroflexota bacterium]